MRRRVWIGAAPVEEAVPDETSAASDEEGLIAGGAAVDLDGDAETDGAGESSTDTVLMADTGPVEVAEEHPATASEPVEAEEAPEPDAETAIPAFASALGIPVPASSMDSLTLPERSRHEADARRHRRRRSAARRPALVAPVDIPEDAEGRIEFIVVRGGNDRDEPAPGATPLAAKPDDRVRRLLTLGSGWVAVAILAAGLFVVFVVLSVLYP
jgi:hypothetical protein